ncbi:hypothetical protein FRB97_002136 [Tulasnella sp. 331]|nr:hypothetical protein FRB97_002136 [Tulasnella sp. 331]
MADTATYSLFDQLTNTTIPLEDADQEPASTDLIAFLLNAVGQDACKATRNTQTLYRFVGRARDVSKNIKTLIHEVDKSDPESDGVAALVAFEGYTKKVGPLEDELFRVAALDTGADITLAPAPTDKLEILTTYQNWKLHREEIGTAYKDLIALKISDNDVPPTNDEIAEVAKYDDLAWLSHVVDSMAAHELVHNKTDPFGKTFGDAVQTVAEKYGELLEALHKQTPLPEIGSDLASRSAMVLLSAIGLASGTQDQEVRRRLKHPMATWDRALKLLDRMLACLKSTDPEVADATKEGSIGKVLADWEIFEAYLLDVTIANLLPIVLSLLAHVGKIRRHYYAQSLALVNLCITLEKDSRTQAGSRDIYVMEEALDAAKTALVAATTAKTTFHLEHHDFNATRTDDAGKAFDSALEKVSKAFTAHNLTTTEPSDPTKTPTKIMEDARNKDEAKLIRLKGQWDRLNAIHPLITLHMDTQPIPNKPASAPVKVTVMLCEGNGQDLPDKTSAELKDLGHLDHMAPVDGLIWKLIGNRNPLEHEPRFFKEEDDRLKAISSATKLSLLVSKDVATVYLAVKNKPAFEAAMAA